jgi:hypothetical protein
MAAAHGAFPAEESGTGSRPTPVFEPPTWLKAMSERRPTEDDRATLTPGDWGLPEQPLAPAEQTPALGGDTPQEAEPGAAAPLAGPSTLRRVVSVVLAVAIGGGSLAVLALAGLRATGHPLPW